MAVVAVLVAVAVTGGDDEQVTSGTPTTAGEPATSAAPGTTTPATTTPPATTSTPAARPPPALWPAEGSGTSYADPVAAARQFAEAFLGFTSPGVGPFQQGDGRSGEVPVRPVADGPVTTIGVRQVTGDGSWSVLGAATANIVVASPVAGDDIPAPVPVRGRAHAFEGHVSVEVRADGRPGPAGVGFVTGGGDQMRPFAGEISFAPGTGGPGALVLLTRSAEDGRVWEAAALPVRLRPGALDPATCGSYRSPRFGVAPSEMEVKVFFGCDGEGEGDGVSLHPAYRVARRSPAILRSALEALLRGPDATERRAAIGSWFSDATAGMLRSVTISGGHAVVDLDDLRAVIPNAGTSAGSRRLLSQLDATVFQFPSVRSAEYRLVGSCTAFNEWLQIGGCERRTPPAGPAEGR